MPLVLTWGVLGAPWELRGLILEPLGFILGGLGLPKPTQSGPGWHSVDIAKTYETYMVFIGLRGWRLPGWCQSGIVDAWIAQLGCLDRFQGDLID